MSVITSQSRMNLGPLTTTFTPDPSCTHFVGRCNTCPIAWLSETCVQTGPQDNPSCWPRTRAGATSPSPTLKGWGFYSPGLVCPSGFTSACTATAGGKSEWPVQFLMTAGETAVGCCPRGFNCANTNGGTCSAVPTSTIVPIVICDNGTSGDLSHLIISEVQTRPFVFYAPLIQINWKPSDRPAAISATATSTTAASTTPSSSIPNEGLSLPVGSIIGITVGGVAASLILAVILFIAMPSIRRKHQQRQLSTSPSQIQLADTRPSYNPQDSANNSLSLAQHNHYYTGTYNEYHNNNTGHQNSNHNTGHQHSNQSAGLQNNNQGAGNQWNGEVGAAHVVSPELDGREAV